MSSISLDYVIQVLVTMMMVLTNKLILMGVIDIDIVDIVDKKVDIDDIVDE